MKAGDLVRVMTTSVYKAGADYKDRVGLVIETVDPSGALESEAQVEVMFENESIWFYESELQSIEKNV